MPDYGLYSICISTVLYPLRTIYQIHGCPQYIRGATVIINLVSQRNFGQKIWVSIYFFYCKNNSVSELEFSEIETEDF